MICKICKPLVISCGSTAPGPLSNKLATQSAKRLIGPRGRSKGLALVCLD